MESSTADPTQPVENSVFLPQEQLETHVELAPPVRIPWPSNRRWREDEFMLPRHLTRGRESIRVRIEFEPVGLSLFPVGPVVEEAWTEYRYQVYCFVMPLLSSPRWAKGGSPPPVCRSN